MNGVPKFGVGGGVEEIDVFGGETWCCHGSLISLYFHSKLPIQPNQPRDSVSNDIKRLVSEGWVSLTWFGGGVQ